MKNLLPGFLKDNTLSELSDVDKKLKVLVTM